ncbi:Ig-like domain-containing protein [Nitrosomonas sp.]|uniref:Ig-like domain-containing protein n=1 Tax=Nitrosomonas sp. TaxID=42353 RepID=UPI0025D449B4|nr:Ig-like domain-containing protein [Nitrosomonas sp.]
MSVATENDQESGKRNGIGNVINSISQVDNTIPILVDAYAWNGQFFSSYSFTNDVIKIDDTLVLYFDEAVVAGSGDIVISNGADTRTIAINDASQVMFNEEYRAVTINPTTDLIPNTKYHVTMTNGVVMDTAGNPFSGISDQTTLNYTTIASDPLLTWNSWGSSTALSGSPEFKIDDNLKLYFDEEVVAGSGNIIISNGSDTRTIAINDVSQVTYSDESHRAVSINPLEDLIPNTTYSVQIASGVIRDTAGYSYTGTSDATPLNYTSVASNPLLVWSNPQDDSTLKLDDNITLYFDEEVAAGSGNIVISNGFDTRTIAIHDASQVAFSNSKMGNTITINPTADLIPNTTYSIQMGSDVITDTAGNAYAGISDTTMLNFTTLASNPLLTGSNPWDESFIGIDNNIFLFFDEDVVAGNGHIIISNGSDTRNIAINDTNQVTFDGYGTVTINPTTDLIINTSYSIQIASGVIMDTDGNPYEGINDQTTLKFNMMDYTGGAIYADLIGIQV